jgi:hypothetical protein
VKVLIMQPEEWARFVLLLRVIGSGDTGQCVRGRTTCSLE